MIELKRYALCSILWRAIGECTAHFSVDVRTLLEGALCMAQRPAACWTLLNLMRKFLAQEEAQESIDRCSAFFDRTKMLAYMHYYDRAVACKGSMQSSRLRLFEKSLATLIDLDSVQNRIEMPL